MAAPRYTGYPASLPVFQSDNWSPRRTTVSYDPPRALLQLAADLFKGFNMGYQSDQMAIGEIVQFAEVILADHKEILKDPTNASNLASILDQFVEVGWPQATHLVIKLDNAVR